MKHITLLIALTTILLSCKDEKGNKSDLNTKNENAIVRKVDWGNKEIAIPKINGMTECYSEDSIKSYADQFEIAENEILAFYLNNETYKKRNSWVS